MKWLPVPSVPRWLEARLGLAQLGMLARMIDLEARASSSAQRVMIAPAMPPCLACQAPPVALAAVVGTAVRHRLLDRRADARKAVRQIVRR